MADFSNPRTADANRCLKDRIPKTRSHKGETVREKVPQGQAERWIDPAGNVVWIQARLRGDPSGDAQIEQRRQARRLDGWLEHHLCPVRSGAIFVSGLLGDRLSMPQELLAAPCPEHPVTQRGTEILDSCPHTEHIIAHRRQRHETARIARQVGGPNLVELEREKLELARAQLDEQRKTNERLLGAVEQLTGTAHTAAPALEGKSRK